ncbi:hypothetical protein PPL_10732 [Heterostelium album PN500]|uniref:Uncharacterized protein n=1 Tax=Heterostelium pallidum (strain ATCC 26659 / Pp 5 / PN500) TaxID=670386 RepID=D3BRW8_HETP5|nr:hypothetical protein PPL_10732 [Heterostelium album PN500]EFA76150.1 hypothetical protein PPL_10732 [Heterostelium album PN500]|eukprot:XP_020428284.1 hypothetical protein PPL_10732 [Heterostelium album PN500]
MKSSTNPVQPMVNQEYKYPRELLVSISHLLISNQGLEFFLNPIHHTFWLWKSLSGRARDHVHDKFNEMYWCTNMKLRMDPGNMDTLGVLATTCHYFILLFINTQLLLDLFYPNTTQLIN